MSRTPVTRRAPQQKLARGGNRLWLSLTALLLATLGSLAQAQQSSKIHRIAVFAYDQKRADMQPFFDELTRLGYVHDQNAKIELWNAEGRAERLPELAEEIGRFKPDVVVASSTPPALAAKKAFPTTAIVFTQIADPVGVGLVTSFANPGGNITGVTNMNVELSGKRAQLLMEILPAAKRIGVLTNPTDPISAAQVKEMSRTIEEAKRRPEILNVRDPKDFEELPAIIKKNRVEALALVTSQLFAGHRAKIVDISIATKIPVIYWNGSFVTNGALMAYGVNAQDLYKRAAFYVDKILKGTAPGDLPVEQPKLFELHINLKTAKQIGLTIPPSVLWRADRVVQ